MAGVTAVVGVDVSTTATKAIVVDESGRVLGSASNPHTVQAPHPQWSEQDPAEWVTAADASIASALEQAGRPPIAGVGLTGQMHGLVLLDAQGRPVRPAILWNDQRTAAECDEIRARVGRRRLIEITGNDALTGFTAPKVLWVRSHEPDHWSEAATLLLPKDYVRLALTGVAAMDRAGGSGTQLFDLGRRTWSPELLDLLELDPTMFPPTHEGPEVTGTITTEAAARTGLAAGTPVMAGGGDQAAAAVGVGALRAGTLSVSLGTSGVVFAPLAEYAVEPDGRLHAFCHAVPDRWHFMGVMLSAAGSLQWFRDTFLPEAGFDEVTELAAGAPPGVDGLLFLPYLTGERTPHSDPLARGAFVGLTTRHGLAHLARAVLEGVAMGLRDALTLVRKAVPDVDEVRITGGGARSPLWRQIVADALESPLSLLEESEGAAYGAALLSAVGAGWASDANTLADSWLITHDGERPGLEWDVVDQHRRYADLYPALAPGFHATDD